MESSVLRCGDTMFVSFCFKKQFIELIHAVFCMTNRNVSVDTKDTVLDGVKVV